MEIKTAKATDIGTYIINQGLSDEIVIGVDDDSIIGKSLLEWRKTNTVEPCYTEFEKAVNRQKRKLEKEKRLFGQTPDSQNRQILYQGIQESQMLGEDTVFFEGEDLPLGKGMEQLRSISLKLRAKDREFHLRKKAIEGFKTLEDVDSYIKEFKVANPNETD